MQYTGTQLRVLWLTVDAVTDNSRLDAMEGLIYQVNEITAGEKRQLGA